MIGRLRNTGLQWFVDIALGGRPPVKRLAFAGARTPYTGEQLRDIRKSKGVGRPTSERGRKQGFDYLEQMAYPALVASHWGRPSPNLAEWQRKQRRGESAEDYRERIEAAILADTMKRIEAGMAAAGYERAT